MGKDIIEDAMAAVMLVGLVFGLLNRRHNGMGIGERFIQYIAFVLAVPATVILALEKLISGETSAAILGVTVGFAAAVKGRDAKSKNTTKAVRATPKHGP